MIDFVHCSGQPLSLQNLWQIVVTALTISSPPFLISSPGILSTPGLKSYNLNVKNDNHFQFPICTISSLGSFNVLNSALLRIVSILSNLCFLHTLFVQNSNYGRGSACLLRLFPFPKKTVWSWFPSYSCYHFWQWCYRYHSTCKWTYCFDISDWTYSKNLVSPGSPVDIALDLWLEGYRFESGIGRSMWEYYDIFCSMCRFCLSEETQNWGSELIA